MICWSVHRQPPGYNRLSLDIGGRTVEKELAIGDGFMQVSLCRPPADFGKRSCIPARCPFRPIRRSARSRSIIPAQLGERNRLAGV